MNIKEFKFDVCIRCCGFLSSRSPTPNEKHIFALEEYV